MEKEVLVHSCRLHVSGADYEVQVFSRPDGSHVAKTVFSRDDIIIHDGFSLNEVLDKHRRLLPLAINSRMILQELRGRA